MAAVIFWACVALVGYTYALYPALMGLAARVRPRALAPAGPAPRTVSFVMAACHEGRRIPLRVGELLRQLDSAGATGEVVLVLDGPGCPEALVRLLPADPRIQVVRLPEQGGKAAAVSEGARRARYEILALADVRQRWQDDALERLLENFRDPRVGAAGGELRLESAPGVVEGVGLYWRYETWLRRQESGFDSVVSVTGAICAVRRALFDGVPAGTINDDVYWPLRVVLRGCRVVHDGRAVAFDRLPGRARDEFRRKVRTLCGMYQVVGLLPAVLAPWRNRLVWQFVSHKLLRLAVPWALLAALVASVLAGGVLYGVLAAVQAGGYLALLLAMLTGAAGRFRLGAAAASFALLNLAAWLALWVWLSGNATRSWRTVEYAHDGQ